MLLDFDNLILSASSEHNNNTYLSLGLQKQKKHVQKSVIERLAWITEYAFNMQTQGLLNTLPWTQFLNPTEDQTGQPQASLQGQESYWLRESGKVIWL